MSWFPSDISASAIERAYTERRCLGVMLDAPELPTRERRAGRRLRDAAIAEVEDGEPYFERSKFARSEEGIVGSHAGKAVYGWQYWHRVDPRGTYGRQLTGDCVSWGARAAIDLRRAWQALRQAVREQVSEGPLNERSVYSAAEQYFKRQATALLYSGRGHTGEGANPASISAWACKQPILLEMDYGTVDGRAWDFTRYDNYVRLGVEYGQRGLPSSFLATLKRTHATTDGSFVGVKRWKLVREPKAVLDLMAQGYFCHVGSTLAWRNYGDPISVRAGSWAHDMACVGFDDRPAVVERFGGTVVFVDQSWGDWNRVTGILPEWQPWGEGMFAIRYDDFADWVGRGECCVMTETVGFEKGEDLPWDHAWFPVDVED